MLHMDEIVIEKNPGKLNNEQRLIEAPQQGLMFSVSEFNQIKEFGDFQKQLEKQEQNYNDEFQKQQSEYAELQSNFKKQTEQFKQLCRTNNQFITTIQTLNDEIKESEENNNELNQQLSNLEMNYKKMRQQNEDLCNDIITKDEEVRKLQENQLGKNQLQFSEQQNNSLNMEIQQINKENELHRKKIIDQNIIQDQLKDDNKELEHLMDDYRARFQKIQKQYDQLQSENQKIKFEKDEIKENFKSEQNKTIDNVIKLQKNKYDLVLRKYQEEINDLKLQVDELQNGNKQQKLQISKQNMIRESQEFAEHQKMKNNQENQQIKALQYQLELKNQLLEKFEDQNQNLKKKVSEKNKSYTRSYIDQDEIPIKIEKKQILIMNRTQQEKDSDQYQQEMKYKKYRKATETLSRSRSFVKIVDDKSQQDIDGESGNQFVSPIKIHNYKANQIQSTNNHLHNNYNRQSHNSFSINNNNNMHDTSYSNSNNNHGYTDVIKNFKQRINNIQKSSQYNI